MDNITRRLIMKLEEAFDGQPWYGDPLMSKLESIDYKIVNLRPSPSRNSIARLVQHIVTWRTFAMKKLQGDAAFDVTPETDWTGIEINTAAEWKLLLDKLRETQKTIVDRLSATDEAFLVQQVPGRKYDYQYMIEGIMQHDIYHLGQIGLIVKIAEGQQTHV